MVSDDSNEDDEIRPEDFTIDEVQETVEEEFSFDNYLTDYSTDENNSDNEHDDSSIDDQASLSGAVDDRENISDVEDMTLAKRIHDKGKIIYMSSSYLLSNTSK